MTDERSGGPWRVNGKTGAGWRIDSLDGSRVGLDFLQHPVALVPSKGDADAIACLPELVERVEAVLAVSPAEGRGRRSAERTAGGEDGPPTGEGDVDLLDPSPTNRRTDFGDMKAFAETIREHGVISPITIRPAGKRFEIVCGDRRWKGAKAAGLKTIPAVVRALLDDEAKEIQIVENLQREDVTPLGEAQGFADLRKLGLSVDDIAAKVGQTP